LTVELLCEASICIILVLFFAFLLEIFDM